MTGSLATFGPRPRTIAGLLLGAAAAAALALMTDATGRLLVGALAVVLAGEAVRAIVIRPVLRVDAGGLTIRRHGHHEHVSWRDLHDVRAQTTRRFLTTTSTLELDLGERLIVLPAYRLGGDAAEVAGTIAALRAEADGGDAGRA